MNIKFFYLSCMALLGLALAPAAAQTAAAEADESALYAAVKERAATVAGAAVQSADIDVSVVLDTFYYHDDSDEGMAHLKEEIAGFGHTHANGEEHHHGPDEGFNLRHVELGLSAAVDPYFRAWSTLAIDDGESEIEEAVIQTSALPYGLTATAGKFFSGIGRLNRQHSHNWDFVDQPLVYDLLLGPHGLQNTGAQLTWLAPTEFYLLVGGEVANSDNEKCFSSVEADELPEHSEPQLFTAFVKFGPVLPTGHSMQFGLSYADGLHQEAHDGNGDGAFDHWLDGRSRIYGADFVYKYDSMESHGRGDLVVQAEYLRREKDLDIEQHDLLPDYAGLNRTDTQDGYYVQALYGFAPRFMAGLRWEQVGLTNTSELDGVFDNSYDSSSRAGLMLDWKPTEFSLLRLQVNRADLTTADGDEEAWEMMAQVQVSFGKHAAHAF